MKKLFRVKYIVLALLGLLALTLTISWPAIYSVVEYELSQFVSVTPLQSAVSKDDKQQVKHLLAGNSDINELTPYMGRAGRATALGMAALLYTRLPTAVICKWSICCGLRLS